MQEICVFTHVNTITSAQKQKSNHYPLAKPKKKVLWQHDVGRVAEMVAGISIVTRKKNKQKKLKCETYYYFKRSIINES